MTCFVGDLRRHAVKVRNFKSSTSCFSPIPYPPACVEAHREWVQRNPRECEALNQGSPKCCGEKERGFEAIRRGENSRSDALASTANRIQWPNESGLVPTKRSPLTFLPFGSQGRVESWSGACHAGDRPGGSIKLQWRFCRGPAGGSGTIGLAGGSHEFEAGCG